MKNKEFLKLDDKINHDLKGFLNMWRQSVGKNGYKHEYCEREELMRNHLKKEERDLKRENMGIIVMDELRRELDDP